MSEIKPGEALGKIARYIVDLEADRDRALEVLKWYADQMCEGWCDGDPKAAVGIGAENCAGCPARGFFANRESQQS